jgi:hypothetical protein
VICKIRRKAIERQKKKELAAAQSAHLTVPTPPPPPPQPQNPPSPEGAQKSSTTKQQRKKPASPPPPQQPPLRGLDINLSESQNGATAAYAASSKGFDKCLSLLITHGGADLSKMTRAGIIITIISNIKILQLQLIKINI